jgi:hypothetical protein
MQNIPALRVTSPSHVLRPLFTPWIRFKSKLLKPTTFKTRRVRKVLTPSPRAAWKALQRRRCSQQSAAMLCAAMLCAATLFPGATMAYHNTSAGGLGLTGWGIAG